MFYSIDRLEGEWAVLIADETCEQILIPRSTLAPDIEEGCILRFEDGTYHPDIEETQRRRKAFFERTKNLSKK
ncbi:MAG: DUF3006 domain-containing protein [Ruminococcus sp.]